MYAIVEIAGEQIKVEKDTNIFVNRLEGKEGDKVDFDNVLFVNNGGKVSTGTPNVSGAKVKAEIVKHLKGDKVIVFKKKRRKGYKVKNGHRQYLTELKISDISGVSTAKSTSTEKKETKAEAKPAAKKPETETKKDK